MVRDRIVFGIRSQKIREKLLTVGADLTLAKAVRICQTYEYAQEQLKHMQPTLGSNPGAATAAISYVNRKGRQSHQNKRGTGVKKSHYTSHETSTDQSQQCSSCGLNHDKSRCPAKGKQCNKCKKWNHFAKVCRSKNVNDIHVSQESSSDSEDLFIDSVDSKSSEDQMFAEMEVGPSKQKLKFKVDTGAQVNVLPFHVFQQLGVKAALKPSKTKLTAYNGMSLNLKGTITLECKHAANSKTGVVDFHVVETNSCPLFGYRSCIEFGLVKVTYTCNLEKLSPCMTAQSVLKDYPQVFEGIGSIPGECEIHLKSDAVPVVHAPRKIPVALRDRCKLELERMVKLGVITKVDEPTDWVNSLICVEKKSGKLRLCIDPHDLNKNVQRPHYPIKTIEDILPELTGAKFFTKLDATSGYWAIKLNEKSSFLSTFNTYFGRYRYLRLPFGLKSSMDIFQRKMDESFEGLSGVVIIVDDILVYGKTREEHDKNLRTVLQRAFEKGLRLNPEKLEVGLSEIQYFGHVLSENGLQADPAKISAIRDMPAPENKAELETFLGMINYLSRFAPNLAEVTSPLRELLSKSVEFYWGKPQAESFNKVKQIITQEPGQVLGYYDPKKPLTLQTDASRSGLGATLLQDEKPIAFASKSLTSSEKNYAQIELECLGILFGLKRYNHWVYGRRVLIETDHLPLIPIFKKPLYLAPARLQRMLLQMQRYDIEVTFRAGKEIPVPDTLSRKPVSSTYASMSEGLDAHVNMVISSLPISDRKLQEIKIHTEKDKQLSILTNVIIEGWPVYRNQCLPEVVDFWNYRDELSVINGLIMKGQKIVIPSELRSSMLEIVHAGHMGVEKTIRRARDIIFWPKFSSDITQLVLNCPTCLEYRSSNPKEPLQSHEIPDYPWQIVGTDLFTWENKEYIVVADYYSHYFEVKELPNMKSSSVINRMKGIFARMGIPQRVISDNQTCYVSEEFTMFAKDWNFQHITSSPHHSSGNGFSEAYVKICKRIFKKAKLAKTDPFIGLLEYRTTPLSIGFAPSEMLMGRKLRSILPTTKENLTPRLISPKVIRDRLKSCRKKEKNYYDRNARSLEPLELGGSARVQRQDKTWEPAAIIDKLNDRSYLVQTSNGATYRRNRRHLIKTNECLPETPNVDLHEQEELGAQPCVEPLSTQETSSTSANLGSNKPHTYVTRSGRVVKPKVIESM